MATQELVKKVWIIDGCIVCDVCETAAPSIFEVQADKAVVKAAALNAEFLHPLTAQIKEAAKDCPVDVIKFETEAVEAAQPAPKPAPAKAAAAPKAPALAAVAAKAPVAAMAGDSDRTMQLLLKAAKARGGKAGIDKHSPEAPGSAAAQWAEKPVDELPPDARQAKKVDVTKAKPDQETPNRREAIKLSTLALGAGWASFGTAAAVTFGPALGRFLMPSITEEPDPKVRVGELSRFVDMAPGEVNEDYKPMGIWMIRLEDRIAALNIICTHLGCIPNWLPNDRKFKCPCHGSGYRQNGVNFEGPTPRPLERFKIAVEDGKVIVDKSRKYQEELGQWENPDSFLLV